MAYLNNVRDGRQSKVYLLKFGTTAITTAAGLTSGKVYVYSQKDGSAPAFSNLRQGDFFVYNLPAGGTAPTFGTDDKCLDVTPMFLGGATDKDLSFEKSTTEITCDKDAAQNIVSPGTVAISGSVTCYDLLQTGDTAANRLKQRFNDMITYSGTTPAKASLDRTEKDCLMFLWDARELNANEHVGIDFVPAFITSVGHGSSYGSGQTFPINFSGADTDEAGHRRSYQQFEYFDDFGTQVAAWETA